MFESNFDKLKNMTVEEFGRYIEKKDHKLIEEKTRKYSAIESDDQTSIGTSSIFFIKDKSSNKIELESTFIDEIKSPISMKPRNNSYYNSIFSSGSSEKKNNKRINPFRNKLLMDQYDFTFVPLDSEKESCTSIKERKNTFCN